jgi:hypothetical protein
MMQWLTYYVKVPQAPPQDVMFISSFERQPMFSIVMAVVVRLHWSRLMPGPHGK